MLFNFLGFMAFAGCTLKDPSCPIEWIKLLYNEWKSVDPMIGHWDVGICTPGEMIYTIGRRDNVTCGKVTIIRMAMILYALFNKVIALVMLMLFPHYDEWCPRKQCMVSWPSHGYAPHICQWAISQISSWAQST